MVPLWNFEDDSHAEENVLTQIRLKNSPLVFGSRALKSCVDKPPGNALTPLKVTAMTEEKPPAPGTLH